MNKEQFLEQFLANLEKNGSKKEQLKALRKKAMDLLNKTNDKDPFTVIEDLVDEIRLESQKFLEAKNMHDTNLIHAISTCIYLPDYNNEGYKIKVIGGKVSRSIDSDYIDYNTIFDAASITKLFTLILIFKLEEHGYFSLEDKVVDLHPDFQGLEDFTVHDLLLMVGELYTNGNIRSASNINEAYDLLKTLYIKSHDKSRNLYTDFGSIVLGKICERLIGEKLNKEVTYDEIMAEYILKPMGLTNTKYNPVLGKDSIAATGDDSGLVHDPKARILGGNVGSAGLFTNSDDLAKLSYEMYKVNYVNYDYMKNLISKNNLAKCGQVTFPNSNQPHKGHLGVYQKHPLGLGNTFVPCEYADRSFAAQGWTGSISVFDPTNEIHNNILVGALGEKDKQDDTRYYKNNKPIGFKEYHTRYQQMITTNSLLILLVKKYYDLFEKENTINKSFKI
jgi:CubicO group peptidase (beta-lactamase class C family)